MPNFFKSFFAGKTENPEEEKQKNAKKNFEIFKYDGLRTMPLSALTKRWPLKKISKH